MMHRYFGFDLDGTLVKTNGCFQDASIESCRQYGITLTPEQFNGFNSRGGHLHEYLIQRGVSDVVIKDIQAMRNEMHLLLLKCDAQWIDGAIDVLEQLRAKGKQKIPIITNSTRELVTVIHNKLQLFDYCDCIITPDLAESDYKPKPDGLHLAARNCANGEPVRWTYIGDKPFDHMAAHAAGWEPWQIGNEPLLNDPTAQPVRRIERLEEILEMSSAS